MNISIREATPNDAPALCAIGIKTFYDAFAGQNSKEDIELYLQQQFRPEVIAQEFTQPDVYFFLAYSGDEVVGYGKLRNVEHPQELEGYNYIELERIYTRQDFHGKGLGAQLLQHATNVSMQRGFDLLWLGVWEHNHKARRFYEKYGFQYFGSHIFMVGNDAQTDLLMKKELQ
jgi:ribosomal protein S18 acetylase RimI-like enzyme